MEYRCRSPLDLTPVFSSTPDLLTPEMSIGEISTPSGEFSEDDADSIEVLWEESENTIERESSRLHDLEMEDGAKEQREEEEDHPPSYEEIQERDAQAPPSYESVEVTRRELVETPPPDYEEEEEKEPGVERLSTLAARSLPEVTQEPEVHMSLRIPVDPVTGELRSDYAASSDLFSSQSEEQRFYDEEIDTSVDMPRESVIVSPSTSVESSVQSRGRRSRPFGSSGGSHCADDYPEEPSYPSSPGRLRPPREDGDFVGEDVPPEELCCSGQEYCDICGRTPYNPTGRGPRNPCMVCDSLFCEGDWCEECNNCLINCRCRARRYYQQQLRRGLVDPVAAERRLASMGVGVVGIDHTYSAPLLDRGGYGNLDDRDEIERCSECGHSVDECQCTIEYYFEVTGEGSGTDCDAGAPRERENSCPITPVGSSSSLRSEVRFFPEFDMRSRVLPYPGEGSRVSRTREILLKLILFICILIAVALLVAIYIIVIFRREVNDFVDPFIPDYPFEPMRDGVDNDTTATSPDVDFSAMY